MPFHRRWSPVEIVEGGPAGGVHAAAQVDEPGGPADPGGEEVRREDVDGEHAGVAIDGPVGFGVGVDAGVVDDGIEGPEVVDGVSDPVGLVEAGEVADDDVGSGRSQRLDGGGSFVVAGVDDDVVPVGEQCLSGGEAESGGRPGDEDARHGWSRVASLTVAAGAVSAAWVAAQEPRRRSRSSDAEPGSAV